MTEQLSTSREVPQWEIGILTLKKGESWVLRWGRRYEVLSGHGTAETGHIINDNVTQWKHEVREVDSRLRGLTPPNATEIYRVTAKSDYLGIMSGPFEKLNK